MVRLVLYLVICLGILPSLVLGEQNVQGSENDLVKIAPPNKVEKKKGVLGKWHSTSMRNEFSFYSKKEYDEAPANIKKAMLPPAIFSKDNAQKWVRVKSIEEPSSKMDSRLKPYSVYVPRAGYSILSISKRIINNVESDVIELGCRIEIENKTNRAIYAYGGCYLYDEHLRPLADSNIARWDQNETGVMIPAHRKIAITRTSNWVVDKNTKPYPISLIRKLDYELFLRQDE